MAVQRVINTSINTSQQRLSSYAINDVENEIHSQKYLSMYINAEAAQMVECFQSRTKDQTISLSKRQASRNHLTELTNNLDYLEVNLIGSNCGYSSITQKSCNLHSNI